MIVLDASVAAKWYLVEAGTDQAEALIESGNELCAPAVIRLEVLSAISRRFRMGGLSAGDAEATMAEWLEDLDSSVMTLSPDDLDLDRAIQLSLRIRHPVVDCLYLACAMRLGADLVTTDENMYHRAQGAYARIRTP